MLNIAATFEEFCDELRLKTDEYMSSVLEITKKLNKKYYDSNSETEHLVIVGSIGRKTAVEGVSDIDVIFELPQEVYLRFDGYESNGQSALLQEVKDCISDRYPNTEIKGDGQVVDVFFDKYTVELVPAFRQSDNSFKYPDSHDDGSWKITDPLPEQKACGHEDELTHGNFSHVAHMIRCWKNNKGFCLGGLLVDTLVYNFFEAHKELKASRFGDYLMVCRSVFKFLSDQDADQAYWFAPGSNQHVYNCDNGVFVRRAERAYRKINGAKGEEIAEALENVFGRKFSICEIEKEDDGSASREFGYDLRSAPHEEFIEDRYRVDITNSATIDCKVTQNGFRPFLLSSVLAKRLNPWLSKDKQLLFTLTRTDVKEPYEVFWKVRNVGEDARRREMERGQIYRDAGFHERKEHTDFNGDHYVECYIVKNKVCVARTRIRVPINVGYLDREHLLYNS